MKRLRIILHSNLFYIIISLLLLIYIFNYNKNTKININDTSYSGIITNYKIKDDLLTIEIKGKEKIIGYYYFKDIKDINYKLGDKVYIEGKFSYPNNNTIFNLFNYKKYLKSKNIFITMNIINIKKIKDNDNVLYSIKNNLKDHISKYKSSKYLETFILGNKDYIEDNYKDSYKENGISHLLAISGMHISFLSIIILYILRSFNIKEEKSLIIVSSFLVFYMFLTSFLLSVCRSTLLFIFISLNKILKLNISTIRLLFITFFILLCINPYYIYDYGFLYSYIISFYLILFRNKLKDKSYLQKLFIISFISFMVSLPLTLHMSFEVNFLSIFLNIIYVPYVSLIVFPLSLLTLLFPILDNIFLFFTNLLESMSLMTSSFNGFKIVFGTVNIMFIILYYLLITIFLYSNNKRYLVLLILLLIIKYNENNIFIKNYIVFIDVNQGDSILIHNKKNILIDTGGIVSFNNKPKNLSKTRLIPLFKSLGIRKLDYLIITHGDYDHMGEAINLINDFKVDKVIFNCGEFNDLEKSLIKRLETDNIEYDKCINNIGDLSFLKTKLYDNENDNSNVIYTELDGYKFMFMGDASTTTEKEILNRYNLTDIDVLKVGHHGSKTSSGKEFINEINPKYSIISVGKNNRYGHPNKEVLDNLKDTKIYRTDQDGSIMFKIKNNKLKIETCSP